MKDSTKRIVSTGLLLSILLSNMCYAIPSLTKEETVYVNLGYYGDIEQINIYTKTTTNGTTEITDYANYTDISNLTNRNEYQKDNEKIIWNVEGIENFSYTGKVGEEYYDKLPWVFTVTYELNGVEVTPDKLLGASGLIKITIKINANPNTIDYYKNNYMLEVTGSYDMSDYLSVNSDEAMVINTGNTKTLMFIVLPGQSTEMSVEIGSEDFKMNGITMAIVPITGNILKELSDIVDEKENIENAMDAINSSTDIILNSLGGMTAPLNSMNEGITEIKNGTKEIHGLNSARDEDIESIKNILSELNPIIENVQTDLDNMITTYEEFIEMYTNLNTELKNMYLNLKNFNSDLAELEKMMDDLPDDISTIKSTIKTLAQLTGNLSSLLQSMDDMQDVDTDELSNNLMDIAKETRAIGSAVQSIYPYIQDEGALAELLAIGESASDIGNNLSSIQSILGDLEETSSSALGNTSSTSKTMKELRTDLNNMASILSKSDAQVVVNAVEEFVDLSNTLEEILNIITEYSDTTLEDTQGFITGINNIKSVLNELYEMNKVALNMINNMQTMLNILGNDIYSGAEKTTDALTSLSSQLTKITSQSNSLAASKNQIKNITDNKMDEIESNTTMFNIDKNAKVVSFGSEKNEEVSQVQFLVKTPDIKEIKELEEDLEIKENNLTFWDRVLIVLDKMFGWIGKLFS